MKDADCLRFLQWALPRLGFRWAGFRRVRRQVCKRLGRRLAVLGLKDLADYRALLETDAAEWRQLDGLCRISVSRFYRDRGFFACLERELIPWLTAQVLARGGTRLRIWSAGCASGEEPYSMALMFAFGEVPAVVEPEILGTDADPHLLERARRACYPYGSLRELPVTWRAAFEPSGEEFCIEPAYRAPVRFLEQDIRRHLPEGRFDPILCRNLVFTYFAEPLQVKITRRLANVLVPGGLLLLGSHESLPEAVPGLVQEQAWLHRREWHKGGRTMLGAIAGDVIGSAYKGSPVKRTDFELFPPGACFTDDTVLMVATAAALLGDGDYAAAYRRFGRAYPHAGYGGNFIHWLFSEGAGPYGSWGNGAAMRVSPVGFAMDTVDEVLAEAARSAAVTHDHPEGIKGAQTTAFAVFRARSGADRETLRVEIQDRFGYDLTRHLDAIRPGYRFDVSCQGSVPESLIAFLESTDFEGAVRNAVSLGGDADTMACIAGGIAHAFYRSVPGPIAGEVRAQLPDPFLNVLDRFERRYALPSTASSRR